MAVFAISALHVTNFHGPRESWVTELLGHHSSIPLAFAILYQDYRFALADLFLKHALTLVLVVAVVFGFWSIAGPGPDARPGTPEAIGLLLGLWVLSTFLFPVIRRVVNAFVDRVVLKRADGHVMLDEITAQLQNATSEDELAGPRVRDSRPGVERHSRHVGAAGRGAHPLRRHRRRGRHDRGAALSAASGSSRRGPPAPVGGRGDARTRRVRAWAAASTRSG